MRGTGLGRKLYLRALTEARHRGARSLYLLTTTAAPFFVKAGFERIDRALVPAAVAASAEFRSLCPAPAVCMRLQNWLRLAGSPAHREDASPPSVWRASLGLIGFRGHQVSPQGVGADRDVLSESPSRGQG
jgi:hypothetical protein